MPAVAERCRRHTSRSTSDEDQAQTDIAPRDTTSNATNGDRMARQRSDIPFPRSHHHPPTLEDAKAIASAEITRDLFTAGAQADWFSYSHLGNCADHVAVSAPKTRRTAGTPDPMPTHHARYPEGADAGSAAEIARNRLCTVDQARVPTGPKKRKEKRNGAVPIAALHVG